MANENKTTEAPAKRKRAAFTRTEKPIYAVLDYVQDGNAVKLDKAGLTITLERDAAKIMERMEAGMGQSIFVKLDMPKAAVAKPASVEAPAA